jgi:glutamate carboxypeptidase
MMLKRICLLAIIGMIGMGLSPGNTAQAGDNTTLITILNEQFKDYCKDLEAITNIDSGTGNAEGSARVAGFLKDKIAALGGTVEFRNNDKGTYVIGRFKGDGTLRILLLAHTDTVFEKGEAAKRPFRRDEKTNLAYGPGAGDDKAVVLQSIYLVKALQKADYRKYGEIIFYISAEEETGSPFSDKMIAELSQQADVCFVMDTAKPDWGVVTQRKGLAKYTIKVDGYSSHAGTPYRGVNAVTELNNQLSMIYKLASPPLADPKTITPEALKSRGVVDYGQFIPENTINVAVIGTTNKKTNVVPDNAFAELEMRFYQMAEGNRLDREIKAMAGKTIVPGVKVTIAGGITMGPMEKTSKVQKIVDIYKGIVKRAYNVDIVEWSSGGLTDGNVSSKYVPTIDSVGVEVYNTHTVREYADLNTYVPRTVTLIECIEELVAKWPIE